MIIITGASGQVGSNIIRELQNQNKPVKAVLRNPEKARDFTNVEVADFFDQEAMKKAFKGGETVFLITPENPFSTDVFSETRAILNNYRAALVDSGIKKLVGLSSLGAQHPAGTGNLVMSYMLEHAFDELSVEKTFIRPAYYFSNWLGFADSVRETGILPTFFPPSLKIAMISPTDVAKFAADILLKYQGGLLEIMGLDAYSSQEVADAFGIILGKKVEAQQIPRENWETTLKEVGFSDNATFNMIQMTEAVIDGKTQPDQQVVKLPTDLMSYLSIQLNK